MRLSPTAGVLKLSLPTKAFRQSIKYISVVQYFPLCHCIAHNFISERICVYELLWLLPTSGEYFMSTAPLEIYLLGKMVVRSILILAAVLNIFTI